MVPAATFLDTPTAYVLPASAGTLSLGAGAYGFHASQPAALAVEAGLGNRLALVANVVYEYNPGFEIFGPSGAVGGGLGLKYGLGELYGWDAAAVGYAGRRLGTVGAFAALPLTRSVAGLEFTVGPRAYLPELDNATIGPLNGATFGLLAALRWEFGPGWELMAELQPAWHASGFPFAAPAVGLGWSIIDAWRLEAAAGVDLARTGAYPAVGEREGTLSATLRYAW